jgi:hypothetical protein
MAAAERSRSRLLALGFAGALVLLAALPGYLALPAHWRPLAMRVAGTVLVIVTGRRVIARVRRTLDESPPSPLDAPPTAPRGAIVDERFVRARDDLVIGSRNRRYFETFLAARLRRAGGDDVPLPPVRGRRGPSIRERAITTLEGAR